MKPDKSQPRTRQILGCVRRERTRGSSSDYGIQRWGRERNRRNIDNASNVTNTPAMAPDIFGPFLKTIVNQSGAEG